MSLIEYAKAIDVVQRYEKELIKIIKCYANVINVI